MNIQIDQNKLRAICRAHHIRKLSLFGSVLRSDFRPDSDIDVLVTFLPDSRWSLFDLVQMQDELEEVLGRKVDLVEKKGLRNPFRRHEILKTKQVVYAE